MSEIATATADPVTAAIISASEGAGIDLSDTSADSGDSGASTDSSTPAATTAEVSLSATPDADPATGDATAAATAAATVETPAQKAEREDLESLGLKPPKPGERENRLPHERVVKMVKKAQEKVRAELAPQLTARDTEIGRLKQVETTQTRLNEFADKDPNRFLEALAVANPEVWKPILAKLAGAPAAATPPPGGFTEAMPKPNFRLPDGSMTYDDTGLADLLNWNERKSVAIAEDRITKKFEERFGPIEESHKAAQWRNEQIPVVQNHIKTARETWGQLFEDDYQKAEKGGKSEVISYMEQHRMPMARFAEACQAVFLPKLRADRTKMRGEIMAELNGRPAAVTDTRSQVKPSSGPETIDQIIRRTSEAAGLKL